MIDIRELVKICESNDDAKIVCTNGQIIIGDIVSVDDEEESGFGEPGISLFTKDGAFIGIRLSDISAADIVDKSERVLLEA